MGFYTRPYRPERPPPPRYGRRLFMAALLVWGCVKIFTNSHPAFFAPTAPVTAPPPSIVDTGEAADFGPVGDDVYSFMGTRLRGTGSYLDLGDRHFRLPLSLVSQFFPDEMILPSCLTEPPPAPRPPRKPVPVRDDWPGFYGAPWTAWVGDNLIALLQVFAPRDTALGVPAAEFQIYPHYNGQQTPPSFATRAPARMYRGSKAVLYRLFLNGPVRCLDLVVQNGENSGTGHLYYRIYHHYYEVDAEFKIRQ